MAYTKKTWTEGTQTSPAKVTIDGTDYEVTPETRTGATPATAADMNHIENGIETLDNSCANINDKFDYSLTEKVIGKWANGKPLYRRTIIGNTPANPGWGNVAEIGNNLTMIKMTGMFGGYLPVPVFIDSNYKLALQYSGGYIQCDATGYNNSYIQITIEYTKSTD